jgi:hypothetical protein
MQKREARRGSGEKSSWSAAMNTNAHKCSCGGAIMYNRFSHTGPSRGFCIKCGKRFD